MTENRPDPDKLLKQVVEEEIRREKGKLKIFFGYAAGVGKTCAMLRAAHTALEAGIDVTAGYIEPHARTETKELLTGIEQLPVRCITYKNIKLKEFDLDAALKRKPQLILIDELAHTNAFGCRHEKRYQDIEELLKAGIDVYTTVNVQHLESLNDIVASVTGIVVRERIPDFVFDQADQIELVDIEPEELLERLREGKVYRGEQAGAALNHFFTLENLAALREIALRRTADQVNQLTERARERNEKSDFYTGEHILICLSPSPSNAKVIRAGARMAQAFKARFTAVHVEVPVQKRISEEDTLRLRMNQRLAEQLGAKTVILYGGDIIQQIAEYARISGVSKIVLGRSYTKKSIFSQKESFSEQLIRLVPSLEIFLIPDIYRKKYRKKKQKRTCVCRLSSLTGDVAVTAVVFGSATFLSFMFLKWGIDESNMITVYILGILLTALLTERWFFSLAASFISVFCFNFLFTAPFYTLLTDEPGYLITLLIMFLSGTVTAALAGKVKLYGRQAAKKIYRMEILLETSQKLLSAPDKDEMEKILSRQLAELLHKDIIYYAGNPADKKVSFIVWEGGAYPSDQLLKEDERAVAAWVYKNNKHAGATTATLPGAKGLYLAVRNGTEVFGVVGIGMEGEILSAFDEGIMNAILNEMALALEKEKNMKEKNQAMIQMKKEQIRADLLRNISGDLCTPLTAISDSAKILINQSDDLTNQQKEKLYRDIYSSSSWLYNLVKNLLSVIR